MNDQEYIKGELLHEGKTKKVYAVVGHPDKVIVENKNDITADDDAAKTRQFGTKAELATTTTCRVFELLNACGIHTTYIKQLSPTSFLAHKSDMVLLEIIGRRYAVGSFLRRFPHLTPSDPQKPHRFDRVMFELFLKTTGKKWNDAPIPCDDPWITNPYDDVWELAHPKPKTAADHLAKFPVVTASTVVQSELGVQYIEDQLLRPVFHVLEKAWALLGLTFVDIKIEIDSQGRVSDVIDSDSWRLRLNGKELSKQVFRDFGEDGLGQVEENYQFVAELSARLRLPRQALVVWREAEDITHEHDTLSKVLIDSWGVEVINVTGSLLQAGPCIEKVSQLVSEFPQGGVIAVMPGGNPGLHTLLGNHSTWPVLSIPKVNDEPIFAGALKMLAITNPAVHAMLAKKRESKNCCPLIS